MGTPQPKGGSIRDDHAALLDKPSIYGDRCCVCGAKCFPVTAKNDNGHHEPNKAQIPKADQHRIPRLCLCGDGVRGCHGLRHAQLLTVRYTTAWVGYLCDEKALAQVNRRRARHSLPHIPGGSFALNYQGEPLL